MFSFEEKDYAIIEANIKYKAIEEKYNDKYIIIMNGHLENGHLYGDVVGLLTEAEYGQIQFPTDVSERFTILKGDIVRQKEVEHYLGFSV